MEIQAQASPSSFRITHISSVILWHLSRVSFEVLCGVCLFCTHRLHAYRPSEKWMQSEWPRWHPGYHNSPAAGFPCTDHHCAPVSSGFGTTDSQVNRPGAKHDTHNNSLPLPISPARASLSRLSLSRLSSLSYLWSLSLWRKGIFPYLGCLCLSTYTTESSFGCCSHVGLLYPSFTITVCSTKSETEMIRFSRA